MPLNITITHLIKFEVPPNCATLDDLAQLEERIMSALSDAIAAATQSADQAIARVQEDVSALGQKIADLQAQVDAGLATQEDLDNLAALTAKFNALDPVKPDTLPEPSPEPAPEPPPAP